MHCKTWYTKKKIQPTKIEKCNLSDAKFTTLNLIIDVEIQIETLKAHSCYNMMMKKYCLRIDARSIVKYIVYGSYCFSIQ